MNKQNLKICIAGLDNAGKTSMLMAIEKIYGFEKAVEKLEPTRQIAYYYRPFLGNILSYWDFGGQAAYRVMYLKRPEYFHNMNVLIYLIDIQDEERFSPAVEYLAEILPIVSQRCDKSQPIFICFSKCDENLVNNPTFDFPARAEMIQKLLHTNYPEYTFRFFDISIFDLITLENVHSAYLAMFFNIFQELESRMQTFAQKNGIIRAFLFDKSGMALMDFTSEKGRQNAFQKEISGLMNYHLRLFRQFEDNQINIPFKLSPSKNFVHHFFQFQGKQHQLDPEILSSLKINTKSNLKGDSCNYYLSMFFPTEGVQASRETALELIEQLKTILAE